MFGRCDTCGGLTSPLLSLAFQLHFPNDILNCSHRRYVWQGAPMNEYTLRLIGSDLEHYIRKLLLGNEIKYNLDCRVLNFSMGKPRYESGIIEVGEE